MKNGNYEVKMYHNADKKFPFQRIKGEKTVNIVCANKNKFSVLIHM